MHTGPSNISSCPHDVEKYWVHKLIRVFSRASGPDLQGLKGLDPVTVIIDDTAAVWSEHTANLVVIERYTYFPASTRQFNLNRPSMLESDRFIICCQTFARFLSTEQIQLLTAKGTKTSIAEQEQDCQTQNLLFGSSTHCG